MAKETRTILAAKNFVWATVGNIINSILGFVSRTIFIYTLGTIYLGINGLFSNILGMLSLAELGIGSAISFSLYKPLAEKDITKIQAIINFYRTAYRIIAAIVSIIGIALIPFLKYIVKGAEGIDNITFIYLLFLFNTVTSYLISYKTTLLSADQRNYLITNINTVVRIVTVVVQMIVLLVFRNFIIYLLIGAVIQLLSKIYLNLYTNRIYPYIKGTNNSKLNKQEKSIIFTKIKALILHKIGEVSIYQTDNIITSAFINVGVVGLVSNFTMIINMINTFILAFFNAATAGLGNMIATETEKRRKEIYDNYDFLAFYFFGWSAICLYFLLIPFVSMWIGEDKIIDNLTVMLLCLNYYLTGMRVPLGNIKSAGGVYEPDRFAPIIQAFINIAISVVGAKYWGLPGIYIGTLLSSMVPNIVRPYVVYKYIFKLNCISYFKEYIIRIILLIISASIIEIFLKIIALNNIYLMFAIKVLLCIIIPNIVLFLIYRKSSYFSYVINTVKKLKR